MKKIETLAAGANFAAVETGKMNELGDYVLELGPGVRIPGKVFGGAAAVSYTHLTLPTIEP